MTISYRIHLRPTPEGISESIAADYGDPVQARSIETVGDSADPAINARVSSRENVTIWMEDINRIEVVHND